MYLGHVSGRKVVPDCRRLGRDRRLQIVGCKKDIPCVLASTLIVHYVAWSILLASDLNRQLYPIPDHMYHEPDLKYQ